MKIIISSFKQIFSSANGTLNIILMAAFAVGALYGIEESYIIPVIQLGGIIYERVKSKAKPRWVGNILTYLGGILISLVPWVDVLWANTEDIISAIIDRRYDKLAGLFIGFVNVLWNILKEKPWEKSEL